MPLNLPAKLLVLHVFPTFDLGGAQRRFIAVTNHFGHALKHVVVAMDGRYGSAERLDPDLDVICLRIPVQKRGLLSSIRAFRRALVSLKPQILVTHNWGAIEWAIAKAGTSARHIHIEDGFGPDEVRGQKSRRVLARRILLRNSAVVVPSLVLDRIARRDWRIPADELHFIPNGIDCARFARHSEVGNHSSEEGPLIGTVAALRAEKNLPRLLRAFALVRSRIACRLIIVGDGPERKALELMALKLGIEKHVTFAGHVVDPSRLYGTFDIFSLTSDTEQMPYTVLEAMAASCPIVATDVGDIRHMVATQNQPFIVDNNDEAIADTLLRLLENEETRREVGAANQKRVQTTYSEAGMFTAFAKLFGIADLAP
jgi:glycosyltransferase involved in cell wall biosynthesis